MGKVFFLVLLTGVFFAVRSHSERQSHQKVMVDPLLKPYVKEWCWAMECAGIPWEERLRSIRSITLEYYDADSRKTGMSYRYSHQITVNRRYLDRNPCAVRSTVFHELGHAAFDLPHDCCAIMRARMYVDEQLYCDNWDAWLKNYTEECKKASKEL